MSVSVRLTKEEKELIKKYAKLNNISVSQLIRDSVMEKIEDEYDLEAYEKAYKKFLEDPETYTYEEVGKNLGIK